MLNEKQIAQLIQTVTSTVLASLNASNEPEAASTPKNASRGNSGSNKRASASVSDVKINNMKKANTKIKAVTPATPAKTASASNVVPTNDPENGIFFARVSDKDSTLGRLRISESMFKLANCASIKLRGENGDYVCEQQGESNGFRGRSQGSYFNAEPGDIVRFTWQAKAKCFLATIESATLTPANRTKSASAQKPQSAVIPEMTPAKQKQMEKRNISKAAAAVTESRKTKELPVYTLADILAMSAPQQMKTLAAIKRGEALQQDAADKMTRSTVTPAKTASAKRAAKAAAVTPEPETETPAKAKRVWVDMTPEQKLEYRKIKAGQLKREFDALLKSKIVPAARKNRSLHKTGEFKRNDRYAVGDVRRYLSGSLKSEFNQHVYRMIKNENRNIEQAEAILRAENTAKAVWTLAFSKTK